MAKKFKIKIGDGEKPTGSGFISWERLQKRFRQIDELQDIDVLHTVQVDENGITYTTKKKKPQG